MHIKTADGKKKVVMSRREWESIGRKASWDGAGEVSQTVMSQTGPSEVSIRRSQTSLRSSAGQLKKLLDVAVKASEGGDLEPEYADYLREALQSVYDAERSVSRYLDKFYL